MLQLNEFQREARSLETQFMISQLGRIRSESKSRMKEFLLQKKQEVEDMERDFIEIQFYGLAMDIKQLKQRAGEPQYS